MKLPRSAMMATGLLLAQQAQAASFVTFGGEAADTPRSVLALGEPASPRAAAAGPDRSIETSALREPVAPPREGPRGGVAAASPGPSAPPAPRAGVAWPPPLSRSMVALGEPRPAEPETVAAEGGSPFGLPTVFRAGLAGDAFTSAPTPAAAATQERAADSQPQTQTPVAAERREATPRDATAAAPPTVPATPQPTMRLE